jgi:hypothetical protein
MKTYEILWFADRVTAIFQGRVCLRDLLNAHDEMISDVRLQTVRQHVLDLSGVTHFDLHRRELKIFAKYDGVMPRHLRYHHVRKAFIAPLIGTKAQMREFIAQGHRAWPRAIFRNFEEAEAWLTQPEDRNHSAAMPLDQRPLICA